MNLNLSYTTRDQFYETFPSDIVARLAGLSQLRVKQEHDRHLPASLEKLAATIDEEETIVAKCRIIHDELEFEKIKTNHEYDMGLAELNLEYARRKKLLENDRETKLKSISTTQMSNQTSIDHSQSNARFWKDEHQFKTQEGLFMEYILWGVRKEMFYALISVPQVRADLELVTAVSVFSLSWDDCGSKLHRLENLGFDGNPTFRAHWNDPLWVQTHGKRISVKTANLTKSEMQSLLIAYLDLNDAPRAMLDYNRSIIQQISGTADATRTVIDDDDAETTIQPVSTPAPGCFKSPGVIHDENVDQNETGEIDELTNQIRLLEERRFAILSSQRKRKATALTPNNHTDTQEPNSFYTNCTPPTRALLLNGSKVSKKRRMNDK